jgi:hypothetical protein
MSEWSDKVARGRGGYFKVTDLEELPGREITLTVAYMIEGQTVGGQTKDVVYFEDDGRRLALNQPNSEACLVILGDEPLDWPGKRITLFLQSYLDRESGTDKYRVALKAPPGTQAASPQPSAENGATTTPPRKPPPSKSDYEDEIPY